MEEHVDEYSSPPPLIIALIYHQQMGSGWTSVPPIDNMNMLYFQHLGFFLKPVCDVELVIFNLDQVLIW